ncbi:MAG: hypothetical protein IJX72_06890 [Clostridia bacterium]|nr:hypothetical protein [Clostridia bacterium]
MKKVNLLLLILLLTLTLVTAVGCELEDPAPAGTDATVTTETAAPETEAETTLTDLAAADALNVILGAGKTDEAHADTRWDMDVTVSMGIDMGGNQNTTTLPVKLTVLNDGEQVQMTGSFMGETVDMIYADGVLYVNFPVMNKKFKCAMTPEEFAAILSGTADGALSDAEDFSPADIFTSVTSDVVDGDDGALTVTCKGFHADMAAKIAPYLRPLLSSVGFVGGQWGENGYEVDDEKALAQVLTLLQGISEDALTVTFTADADGVLRAVTMDVTMILDESNALTTKRTAINFNGTATVTYGDQTVIAPADADRYADAAWEDILKELSPIT